MKMNSLALIVVLAALNGRAAMACNHTNPNPMDLTCTMADILHPAFASPSFYTNDPNGRLAMLNACRDPRQHVPASWCNAAAAAQRITGVR